MLTKKQKFKSPYMLAGCQVGDKTRILNGSDVNAHIISTLKKI